MRLNSNANSLTRATGTGTGGAPGFGAGGKTALRDVEMGEMVPTMSMGGEIRDPNEINYDEINCPRDAAGNAVTSTGTRDSGNSPYPFEDEVV